jgi:hypothetical protein
MRGRRSSRKLATSGIAAMAADGREWVKLGKVFAPDMATDEGGEDTGPIAPHWHIEKKRNLDGSESKIILVEVETIPNKGDLTCRLGSTGMGGGSGLWAIPKVGALVVVVMPDGVVEFMPVIIAVLDNNAAPARVGEDKFILVSTVPVEITAPKVLLGPNPETISEITDGLVHGMGIDPFTGQTYANLQATTSKVFAKKV